MAEWDEMDFHEIWEPIREFPKYSVSNTGHVGNNDTGVVLRPIFNPTGSAYVGMFKGPNQYKRSIPKLVATEFLPKPSPAFDTPINLNGDRANNDVRNLLWRPRWFAVKYHHQFVQVWTRLGKVQDVDSGVIYANVVEAAIRNGLLFEELWLNAWGYTRSSNAARIWPTNQMFRFV